MGEGDDELITLEQACDNVLVFCCFSDRSHRSPAQFPVRRAHLHLVLEHGSHLRLHLRSLALRRHLVALLVRISGGSFYRGDRRGRGGIMGGLGGE